ncbi:MAG: hypothetical protein ACJA13_003076 [Paraglaciecola sp.]|jgi:hypothetical protein
MSLVWNKPFVEQQSSLPLAHLEQQFHLTAFDQWPNAQGLNQLKSELDRQGPPFICQQALAPSDAYYEKIIFQQGHIPTRPDSWHDLFNALVWLQFPKTKSLLNRLHVADITEFGLSPRTKRRNHLTHFDECGVVLAYTANRDNNFAGHDIIEALTQHQWQRAFVEHKACWGTDIHAMMFGHANYEMMLQPFIGLTGKWLAIEVGADFADKTLVQRQQEVDNKLVAKISDEQLFSQPKPLLPLPLLGVPGWCEANVNPGFYDNRDYFRPKRGARG